MTTFSNRLAGQDGPFFCLYGAVLGLWDLCVSVVHEF